ncbi:hypothetical protein SCALIN_C11_0018 [Candidatus Scalindua japonica]|uniref:Fervidolysin-like N-terminal prodomain domain-containing protein n=1 Tax=Candidatus Scalindua japonica TaxID=1284222 RepID=A0A286TWY3_9BACT|nr:hypothetical protein [Candidatus Scalindua japonica]GAX60407.1 hypothetical protein SCALIN_C11_0018 [Candidatus Scalindua japonica]
MVYKLYKIEEIVFFVTILLLPSFLSTSCVDSADVDPSVQLEERAKTNLPRIMVKFEDGVADASIAAVLENVGVRQLKTFEYTGICVLEVTDSRKTIKEICLQLNNSGIVKYAEVDHTVSTNTFPGQEKGAAGK